MSCAALAAAGLCPRRLDELYGGQAALLPAGLPRNDVLALHCALECTPDLCMNSPKSEARVAELLGRFQPKA